MTVALIMLIAVSVVFLASLARRSRETDILGHPVLRLWSVCLLGFFCGAFFLYETLINLNDPFHQRHPENTAIEVLLLLFGFGVSIWSYFFRITLSKAVIEIRYPLLARRVYDISSVDSIDSLGRNNDVILLRNGRRIMVTPLLSGRRHFLETLRGVLPTQDSSDRKDPRPPNS
jgi:hypothetical protein